MRRLLPILPALTAALVLAGCADEPAPDRSEGGGTTAVSPSTTSDTLPLAVAESFDAEDVAALCGAFERLSAIDPDVDPTQAQVDQLRAVARTAPVGVAEPLQTVAAFGQAVVDGEADAPDLEAGAAEASLVLVAYGIDACGVQVPLFDRLSGFDIGGP